MSKIENSPVRTADQRFLEEILSEVETVSFISHNKKSGNSVFRHNTTGNYFYLKTDSQYVYFIPDNPTGDYKEVTTEISSQLGFPGKSFESRFWKKPQSLETVVIEEPIVLYNNRNKGVIVSSSTKIEVPKKEKVVTQKVDSRKMKKGIPHKLIDASNHELTRKVFGNAVPAQIQILGYQEKRTGLYVKFIGENNGQNSAFWITQENSNIRLLPGMHATKVPETAIKFMESLTGKVATPIRKTSSKLDLLEKIVTSAAQQSNNGDSAASVAMRYLPRNLVDAKEHQITKTVFKEAVPEQFHILGYQDIRRGIFVNYGQFTPDKKNAFWILDKGKSKFKLVPAQVDGEIPKEAISQLETITGKVAYPVKRSEHKYILTDKKAEVIPKDQREVGPTNLSAYEQTQAYLKIFAGKVISERIKVVGYDSQTDRIYITIQPLDAQGKQNRVWLSAAYDRNEIKVRPFGYNEQISEDALNVLESQFEMKAHLMARSQRKYRLIGEKDLLAEEKARAERAVNVKTHYTPRVKKAPKELTRALPSASLITSKATNHRLPGFLCDAFNGYGGLHVFAYDDARKGLILRHEDKKGETYTFGIGFGGKCVFLRKDSGGLSGEPSQQDIAEITSRLNATKYEYSTLEKAAIWYVDGLVEKFPEIKF